MKAVSFFKEIIKWLFAEPRLWWFTVIVLLLCLGLALMHKTEPRIRLMGVVLQMFGLLTVVWGIYETQELFGIPDLHSRAINWLERRPQYPSNGTPGVGGGHVTVTIGPDSAGYSWRNVGPVSSVEERMAAFEENLSNVNARLDETRSRLQSEVLSRAREMKSEQRSRKQSIDSLSGTLKATETSGLDLTLVGVIWMAFGLVLSSLSGELSKCIR